MTFPKPRYYTIHEEHLEDEIYLSSGLNPNHQLDEIVLKKNDVTECYPDSRIFELVNKGVIVEVDYEDYKTSGNYYKGYINSTIDSLEYIAPLDIGEFLIDVTEKIEDRKKFLSDLKLFLPLNLSNRHIITHHIEDQLKKYRSSLVAGLKNTLTDTQIESLYSDLKGKYFNCSLDDFKSIFSDKAKSIDWKNSTILLAYIIKNCEQITDTKKWSKTEKIFGVKSLQQSLNNNPYPKGYEKLEEILKNL